MFPGVGFKHLSCSLLLGEMIQFDSFFLDGLKPPNMFVFFLVKNPVSGNWKKATLGFEIQGGATSCVGELMPIPYHIMRG